MDYEVSTEIEATAARVWAVMAELEEWPGWTTSMREVTPLGDGPVGEGSRVRVRQPSLPTVVWTISDWQPERRFTWESTSPGVATAADHELRPDGDRTTVVLRVRQSGLLAPLVHRIIGKRTRTYMQMEADGLKARSEAALS